MIEYIWISKFESDETKRIDSFVKWITNYSYELYDWRGALITLQENWTWRNYACWHCSCNWPLEAWYSWSFTADEMIKLVENFDEWEAGEEEKAQFISFIEENNDM